MAVRQLRSEDLNWIESFALCELSLDELRQKVSETLGPAFRHNPNFPWVNLDQLCAKPTLRITRQHVEGALEKRRRKQISERQLIDWATMILTNTVYYWEGDDAAVIAEWVDRISLDLIPED